MWREKLLWRMEEEVSRSYPFVFEGNPIKEMQVIRMIQNDIDDALGKNFVTIVYCEYAAFDGQGNSHYMVYVKGTPTNLSVFEKKMLGEAGEIV
jgi:hypothetical protein